MAHTLAATTGPTTYRTLDLDAGTTLPAVARVALLALVVGAVVLLTVAGWPGEQPHASTTGVRSTTVTVPVLRPAWSAARIPGPARPIGPVAATDLAPNPLAVIPPQAPTGPIDDRE